LSDAKVGRTLLDWADDVTALVDTLGIDQFSLIGFFGGSPHPLACAYKLPRRIRKIALVGAYAPFEAPGVTTGISPTVSGLLTLAQANPVELRNTFAAIAPTPEALAATMCASLGESEKQYFNPGKPNSKPNTRRHFVPGLKEWLPISSFFARL